LKTKLNLGFLRTEDAYTVKEIATKDSGTAYTVKAKKRRRITYALSWYKGGVGVHALEGGA
jgi:hypothetical protein